MLFGRIIPFTILLFLSGSDNPDVRLGGVITPPPCIHKGIMRRPPVSVTHTRPLCISVMVFTISYCLVQVVKDIQQ